MGTKLKPISQTASVENATETRNSSPYKKITTHKDNNKEPKFGTGSCTLCDCPEFKPATGAGKTCINTNSEGGTCNHLKTEHN
jgi:hypothetical protein